MKSKLSNIEFMRAFCALAVVIYHFAHYSFCSYSNYLEFFANGKWGEAVVIVFFALSGAMLYLNNPTVASLKKFYFKRFKAVFPMFYIAFLIFFTKNALEAHTLFYRTDCSPWTLLYTLIGMDGYLRYSMVNYYILGEWFLGAIILLYIIYPLLNKLINKLPVTTALLVTGLFAFELYDNNNLFKISTFTNLFSCLFAFYIGIILFKHKRILEYNYPVAISIFIFVIVGFVPLPISETICQHILGYSMFFILFRLGTLICKIHLLEKISIHIGKLSYPIFLLQAVYVQAMLNLRNPFGGKHMLIWMFITILVIILLSWILQLITNWVLKLKPLKVLDKKMLK